MNITLERERYWDCIEEIKPMLAAHWEEVAGYKDKIEYIPDWEQYHKLEEMGLLRMYILRVNGLARGYWVFFVTPHLHYSTSLYAMNDIVYIDQPLRGFQSVGWFKKVEGMLKEEKVDVITYHMKTNKPFDGLMTYLEYNNAERLYSKCIRG